MSKVHSIVNYFFELRGWSNMPREWYRQQGINYARYCRAAKQLLTFNNGDEKKSKEMIDKIKGWAEKNGLEWSLETTLKRIDITYPQI